MPKRVKLQLGTTFSHALPRRCQKGSACWEGEITNGICQKLRDVGLDVDRWLTDTEKLVDESQDDREKDTNCPGSDGRARHAWIVFVGHDGSHLRIGAVVGNQSSLKLHLVDESRVLLGILKNIIVGCRACGQRCIQSLLCKYPPRNSSMRSRTAWGKLGSRS